VATGNAHTLNIPHAKLPVRPCIPIGRDRPDCIHEVKHDGHRLIVLRDPARVRLFTRKGHDWSDQLTAHRRGRAVRSRFILRHRWRGGAAQ
jgi:hypothetical protein